MKKLLLSLVLIGGLSIAYVYFTAETKCVSTCDFSPSNPFGQCPEMCRVVKDINPVVIQTLSIATILPLVLLVYFILREKFKKKVDKSNLAS